MESTSSLPLDSALRCNYKDSYTRIQLHSMRLPSCLSPHTQHFKSSNRRESTQFKAQQRLNEVINLNYSPYGALCLKTHSAFFNFSFSSRIIREENSSRILYNMKNDENWMTYQRIARRLKLNMMMKSLTTSLNWIPLICLEDT